MGHRGYQGSDEGMDNDASSRGSVSKPYARPSICRPLRVISIWSLSEQACARLTLLTPNPGGVFLIPFIVDFLATRYAMNLNCLAAIFVVKHLSYMYI